MGSCIIDTGGWKREPEGRPNSGRRLDGDPSMMGLDDGSADRQPHAHSPGTRAEIGVEDPPETLRRDSLAVVGHAELDGAGIGPAGFA